jgi:hypothetical protein
MSDEQRAIAKAKQAEYMRKKRAEVKASNSEKYEKNLARHRKYYEKTKEQRLAQQKEYRSNMSEEEKQQRRGLKLPKDLLNQSYLNNLLYYIDNKLNYQFYRPNLYNLMVLNQTQYNYNHLGMG